MGSQWRQDLWKHSPHIQVSVGSCYKPIRVIYSHVLQALEVIEEISDSLGLRYSQMPRYKGEIVYGAEDELEWHTYCKYVLCCLMRNVLLNHHGLASVSNSNCDTYQRVFIEIQGVTWDSILLCAWMWYVVCNTDKIPTLGILHLTK